jgi:uncharacterized integral membrane protein
MPFFFTYNFGLPPSDGRVCIQYGGYAMKYVFRIIAAILFVVFFGFALKNTQEVTLHFFLGYETPPSPLVLLLLAFFAGGAVLGILAMIPIVFRHKRDISKHRKTIAIMEKENETQRAARMQPPQPDSVAGK